MTTSEERIAKALEALALIAQDIKNEWRSDRETSPSGAGIPPIEEFDLERNAGNRPYILLEGLTTGNVEPGKTKFFGQLVAPEGMTLRIHGTYEEVI